MLTSKKGLTMVEAVASIFIVTIVLAASLTLLFQIRRQSIASQERLLSQQVILLVFEDIARKDYNAVSEWLITSNGVVTKENCITTPLGCLMFSYELNGKVYDHIIISFEQQDQISKDLKIIKYQVSINYYLERQLQLGGVLYG